MADVEIKSSSSNAVDILGLDNLKADLTLHTPDTLKTDATNTYDIKPLKSDHSFDIKPLKSDYTYDIKPLQVDDNIKVDLRPVTLDLCMTANVGKIPDLCVRQPYRHRIAFSLYGMEVWGFTLSGEQETVVQEMDRRPHVASAGAPANWPSAPRHEPHHEAPKPEPPTRTGNGLRIRLGP